MVVKLGINEWPMPGRIVHRSTYLAEYHELTKKDGQPFVPGGVWKDAFFCAAVLAAVTVAPRRAFTATGPAAVLIRRSYRHSKPDFFFLWLYSTLSYLPPSLETPLPPDRPCGGNRSPDCPPFLCGGREKSWRRRPIAILPPHHRGKLGSTHEQGHPRRGAEDGRLERRTAAAFSIHPWRERARASGRNRLPVKTVPELSFLGGLRWRAWSALDVIATRMTQDQMIRQVLQGGGNMPAYGKNLSPSEVTALVSFLMMLHPQNQPPAADASQSAVGLGPGSQR